mmetsp:Transcript_23346/g.57622  ORF Transcript_23346/g.57622 Transcript_23346/m.57622 type:complete len:215 (+) Transcript_23346:54-698(+)
MVFGLQSEIKVKSRRHGVTRKVTASRRHGVTESRAVSRGFRRAPLLQLLLDRFQNRVEAHKGVVLLDDLLLLLLKELHDPLPHPLALPVALPPRLLQLLPQLLELGLHPLELRVHLYISHMLLLEPLPLLLRVLLAVDRYDHGLVRYLPPPHVRPLLVVGVRLVLHVDQAVALRLELPHGFLCVPIRDLFENVAHDLRPPQALFQLVLSHIPQR